MRKRKMRHWVEVATWAHNGNLSIGCRAFWQDETDCMSAHLLQSFECMALTVGRSSGSVKGRVSFCVLFAKRHCTCSHVSLRFHSSYGVPVSQAVSPYSIHVRQELRTFSSKAASLSASRWHCSCEVSGTCLPCASDAGFERHGGRVWVK